VTREKELLFTSKFQKKRRNSEKMKILGIDDNEDLLNLCETVLTSDYHEYTGISDLVFPKGLNDLLTYVYQLWL